MSSKLKLYTWKINNINIIHVLWHHVEEEVEKKYQKQKFKKHITWQKNIYLSQQK